MRIVYVTKFILVCTLTLMLAACGSDQSGQSAQPDYKEMKTMVIDILKTDEAQKAIEQSSGSSGSSQMQMLSSPTGKEQIRSAVKDTLTSPDYSKEMQKIMTDPKFAGEFATAINKDNKKIHKELIKDPTYQASVADILKSPDVQKSYLDLTKTPEFRKQIMAVVKESMSSPLFKMQVMELLTKVVQEELQPKESGQKGGKQGQSSGGGGGGSSGGGEGGGGGGGSSGGSSGS
ncbi:spore gernimation protein [Paenibacillus selenitireducens]|uniref:Spore gernimation protein n=1 Tax=Paenibacillus selenitireducens TaxID=1324314 RepID=A0A1T2WZS6_9BACL|nr:spore germination lipoprotein GerD [Paenibacillus selenitireducens]OPA73081.1 spore gernimation protein [Paenibacillus selenitireducens]